MSDTSLDKKTNKNINKLVTLALLMLVAVISVFLIWLFLFKAGEPVIAEQIEAQKANNVREMIEDVKAYSAKHPASPATDYFVEMVKRANEDNNITDGEYQQILSAYEDFDAVKVVRSDYESLDLKLDD